MRPRLVALILTVALVGLPSGARADEFSREVVVGDAKIGIVYEGKGQPSVRHGILAGIASVTDGRVTVADYLVSLTAVERSSAGSAGGGTVLPWEEAEPLLARVLANHDSLDSVPASGEADLLGSVGQRMYLPRGLVKSARVGLGRHVGPVGEETERAPGVVQGGGATSGCAGPGPAIR